MAQSREQMEQDLLDYVEGRLPPAEHARVEIYLANTDPKLARQIAGMMDDRRALQSLPALTPPSDLADRIMSGVERQSLIGGVERQLTHEPRRWFQTRMAIAAGLIVVIGGFSFVVLQNLLHPSTEMQKWAANPDGKEKQVANNDAPKNLARPADRTTPPAENRTELAALGQPKQAEPLAVPGAPVAPALPARTPAAAPATLADNETQVNDQIKQGRMLALGNLDGQHAGYQQAANTQDALALLKARSRDATDTSTIVITLVSRDGQDVQRLESLLTTYADQADARKAIAAATQPGKDVQGTGGVVAMGAAAPGGGAGGGGGGFGGGGGAGGGRGGRGGGAAGGAGGAAPRAAAAGPAGQVATNKVQDRRINNMATPDTYHVLLRPDQLDQISQSFVISSVARGSMAYSVANNSPGNSQAITNNSRDDFSAKSQNGQFSNQVQQGTSNQILINGGQSQTYNGGTSNGGNFNNNNDSSQLNLRGNNNSGETTTLTGSNNFAGNTINSTSAPATGPVANFDKAGSGLLEIHAEAAKEAELPWIDCVITIVPAPAATVPAVKN